MITNKTSEVLFGCFGAIIFAIVIVIFTTIINGLVFVQLWDWFIATTFGVSPLTLPQALGLSLVVGSFTRNLARKSDTSKDKDPKTFSELFGKLLIMFVSELLTAGLTLLIGQIIYNYMTTGM